MINKSSMRTLALALCLACAGAGAQTPAAADSPAAGTAGPPGAAPLEIARDAPDKHVVVKGDTLWDISGKFLEKPWRWPEIWALNREQIRNPHLIYPGDIVYLDRSGASPRLRLGRPVTAPVGVTANVTPADAGAAAAQEPSEVARPRVRSQPLATEAIPTIRASLIEPFLNRPLIVEATGQQNDPRIVGTQEGRVFLGRGDIAYVRGLKDQTATDWYIYRTASALKDPDTLLPIAYEAVLLGSARIERRGDPAVVRIVSANEEIGDGDRLVPADRAATLNFAPRAPQVKVEGRIVSVYRGVSQAGRNSVVTLNRGARQGIEVSDVLAIRERSRQVKDRQTKESISLPGELIGRLLVFRVFDNVSYGLIVDAYKAITVGDDIVNP